MKITINGEVIPCYSKKQTDKKGKEHEYLRASVVLACDLSGQVTQKKTITAPNEEKLREKILEIQHERKIVSGYYVTLPDFALKCLHARTLYYKPITLDNYLYCVEQYVVDYFRNDLLANVDEAMLNTFYRQLIAGHGILAAHRTYEALNIAFGEALERQLIYCNPQKFIKLPRKQFAAVFPLSREEAQELIRICGEDDAYSDAILFALYLGLRISEVIGLSVEDIDYRHRLIHIRRQINQKHGKGGYFYQNTTKSSRERILYASDEVMKIIDRQLARQRSDKAAAGSKWQNKYNCLFTDPNGHFLRHQALRVRLHIYCDMIDRPNFKFHHLRHSFASLLNERTNNIYVVKDALGHKYSDTTSNYVHSTKDQLMSVMNSLTDYITPEDEEAEAG